MSNLLSEAGKMMKLKKLTARLSGLAHLSVKARLIGVLGLLGVMLAAGALVGIGMMSWQNEGMRRSYEEAMIPAQLMGELRAKSLLNFTVLGEAANVIDHKDQVQQKVDESRQIQADIGTINKKLSAMPMSAKVAASYKNYRDTDADYRSDLDDIYAALADQFKGTADMLEMQVRPQLMMRLQSLDQLTRAQSDEMKGIYEAQVERYHLVRALVIIALIGGLVFAALVSTLLVRSLTHTLKHLAEVAYAIAEGRLGHTIKVKRRDELGRLLDAFRVMDERLTSIVGEVRQGSEAVSSAAQQITHGNEGLSQRTQEQASSLVQTSSSMEEMSSTVKQNADNASHANQLARSARERAESGGEVVREAVAAMADIDAASSKIGDIVRLIQDIAFQTNLLALNAAVEAARAGEQGRGFAVVATEVRNLAQRSADAATEIKGLITNSEEKVRAGSTLVNQSGEALSEIVESVKKVTDIVAEIATANQEQSVGIDQVSSAVTQIEEMTQQNSALVEQASAAAHSMQDQAIELARQVSFFRLNDDTPAADEASATGDDPERATRAVLASARKAATPSGTPGDNEAWLEF